MKANVLVIPLYKFLGIYVAQINIPQIHLPITADELVEQIRVYQTRYASAAALELHRAYADNGPGVWPPPPSDRK